MNKSKYSPTPKWGKPKVGNPPISGKALYGAKILFCLIKLNFLMKRKNSKRGILDKIKENKKACHGNLMMNSK